MPRCLQSIDLNLVLGEFTGSADAVYPRFARVGNVFRANTYYALVGLELSSSMVVFGGRGALMLVIGKQTDFLEISESLTAPVMHLTAQNSIVGPPALTVPTSKVTPLSFGAFGLEIPPNTPICLYASLDATADNEVFGACSLQLIEVRAPGRG